MRRVTVAERRARLGRRHHLAAESAAADAVEVARSLAGLHATDPASVFLAVRARAKDGEVAAVERALYDERTLVRMLGMRRTMFVEPIELVPVVHAACTRAIAVKQRRQLIDQIERSGLGVTDGDAWLRRVEVATLQAVAARGEATATELAEDVRELRERIRSGFGTRWEGEQGASTRVLFLLSAAGHLVRGRPRGSWTSSQYRWAAVGAWLSGGVDELGTGRAQLELARRWLAAFGPGTVADLKWWTGWTVTESKRALAEIGAVEVALDGATGFVLPDDDEPVEAAEPWVALLPSLDPTLMGWAGRDWYLGGHGPALFDRSGNPGPTVWCDGRIVGGWAQRPDGEIGFRLLEDVGAGARGAVEGAAARLGAWLGDVRVTPRFRTPLERELSA